jgi:hypothetical protein
MRRLSHRSSVFGIVKEISVPIEIKTARGKKQKIKAVIKTHERIRYPGDSWQSRECFFTVIFLGYEADRACHEVKPGSHIRVEGYWQTRMVENPEKNLLPLRELRCEGFSVMRDDGRGNFFADTPRLPRTVKASAVPETLASQ